jgi:hypothetical protein
MLKDERTAPRLGQPNARVLRSVPSSGRGGPEKTKKRSPKDDSPHLQGRMRKKSYLASDFDSLGPGKYLNSHDGARAEKSKNRNGA